MSGGMGGGEAGVDPPTTTKGDLSGFDTTFDRVPIGSNTQVLTADSTEALGLKWATPTDIAPPTTTKGDLSGFSTVQSRIGIGSNDQVLTADSTQSLGLAWKTAGGGATLSSQVDNLSSTFTTNSDTFVSVSGMSLTLANRSGGLALITTYSTLKSSTTNGGVLMRHMNDGSPLNGLTRSTSNPNNTVGNTSFTDIMSLDGSVITLQVRSSSQTATLYGNDANLGHTFMNILEIS